MPLLFSCNLQFLSFHFQGGSGSLHVIFNWPVLLICAKEYLFSDNVGISQTELVWLLIRRWITVLVRFIWSRRKLLKLFSTTCTYLPSFRNIILLEGFPILSTTLLPCTFNCSLLLFSLNNNKKTQTTKKHKKTQKIPPKQQQKKTPNQNEIINNWMQIKVLSSEDYGWAGSAMFSWRHCFISSYSYAKYSIDSCGLEKTCLDGHGKDEKVSEKTLSWCLVLMTSDVTVMLPGKTSAFLGRLGSGSWLQITAEILCPGRVPRQTPVTAFSPKVSFLSTNVA